jgi:biotin operon repressor
MEAELRRSLPPLNALRSFEAAARHQSFTRAADELCVTQAAVSHQVKALEAELGLKLFNRERQGLAITGTSKADLTPQTLPFARDTCFFRYCFYGSILHRHVSGR